MTDGMKRPAESIASGYFGEVDSEESESLPPREDLAEEPGNRRNGRLAQPTAPDCVLPVEVHGYRVQARRNCILGDSFGVLGVWPAAWTAAQRVMRICNRQGSRGTLRMLEIGCGSGLPSLCALALGAEVVATDLEELPLQLLQAAADAQELPGSLEVMQMDVLKAADSNPRNSVTCPSDVERFDIIVCSDCLYKHDVARAIAVLIGRVPSLDFHKLQG
eukprot:s95_g8.t1